MAIFDVLTRWMTTLGWKAESAPKSRVAQREQERSSVSNAEKEIVQKLLSTIFAHETLSTPVYCGHLRSEEEANRLSAELPLVYIWNEDRERRSFSISINGLIVGSILEQMIPRSDASFEHVRDEAMRVIRDASQNSVISTCEKLGALPSNLF